MKIIVCVRRVPDTEAQIKIAPDGKSLDAADINFIMNPYEEYAVEAALRLREAQGGEVVIYSLGPDEASKEIRNALAMGADTAVHLVDDAYHGDSYATATALAGHLRGEQFDLLLFGKTGVDDGAFSVGPMVAELLGLPSVSSLEQLEVANGVAHVSMPVEGGSLKFEVPLPAVFTTDKGLNEPRYPTLKGIMGAKKKKLDARDVTTPASKVTVTAMTLPPVRPAGKIVGKGVDAVPELVKLLQNEAKVL